MYSMFYLCVAEAKHFYRLVISELDVKNIIYSLINEKNSEVIISAKNNK